MSSPYLSLISRLVPTIICQVVKILSGCLQDPQLLSPGTYECGYDRLLTAETDHRCVPSALVPILAAHTPAKGKQRRPGRRLFTFLSMRTVKTSRSLSGSLLSTSPWLNSWTGWFRRAVRFELERPISFPLRGCSSAAIFSGRPVFTTPRLCDSNVTKDGK